MVTIPSLLETIAILIVVWIVVSIPAYIAGKIVVRSRATFGEAMKATLGGTVAFAVVLVGASLLLGPVLGASANALGLVLAFIVWLAVYRASFHTGWGGALLIAILSVVVVLVIGFLLASVLGSAYPSISPFPVPNV